MGDKLTAQQAAARLGYSVRHLQRLLRWDAIHGERFNRVWMIDTAEVERVRALQDEHGRYHHGKTATHA